VAQLAPPQCVLRRPALSSTGIMKYKDYYASLGLERGASDDDIKKAYRRLARKYHPDVSKEAGAEEKFKEIAEAYQTLKDPEKRAAYDQLGSHAAGQEFEPPPSWQQQYSGTPFSADDIDLSDLFAHLRGGGVGGGARGRGARMPMPGHDYEIAVAISIDEAFNGTQIDLDLNMPEYDEQGRLHRVPRTVRARIPKGATDGQRLRLPGKGGKGLNGGRDGDLYLNISLRPHPLYRANGHDLYLDLPLAPWEAVLGTSVEVPTPGGVVRLKVPAGTQAGRQLRLPQRGLPTPKGGHGDLYAIVQIVVPGTIGDAEREFYQKLADISGFDPRGHFAVETGHAH
jgi:curved DNA-binding protein